MCYVWEVLLAILRLRQLLCSATGIREESADASLLSDQQSLQQDQLPSLDHRTFEPLQVNPAFQEAQQQAAAGTAEKEQLLASKLLQQCLASTGDGQTAQAGECQAASYAHANVAYADIAPAVKAGHVQESQAHQPTLQSSFGLGQLQTPLIEEHRETETALVDSIQQSSPDTTAAGALLPVQQVLEAGMTMDEADAEALDIGSVGVAFAEAHHAEVKEPLLAFASLNSDVTSELTARLGQQMLSHVQPGPGTGQLDSDKGRPGFAGGQLGPNKGQPEVGDGQPDISIHSGLFILQPDVSNGLPVLHSEQLAPSIEQLAPSVEQLAPSVQQPAPSAEQLDLSVEQLPPSVEQVDPSIEQLQNSVEQLPPSVEQLQSRPGQPSLCTVQADAAGTQPDSGGFHSTQPELQPESLQLQVPANLQILDCVQDHQPQRMQSQQPLPAASAVSSSLKSHADAQQDCVSPMQLPIRLSMHAPAALQSQLSEALASPLESHVSAQQAYISPFQPTQGLAAHEAAALQSQLSKALASSTSELPLLDPETEQRDGGSLSPHRLCSQLLAHLSVHCPGLQQPDRFQPQSAEAIPGSASALLQLYHGLKQLSSDVTQSPRQLCQSLSSMSRQQPGVQQPDSFQHQSAASLSRSVSSLLQLYPGLEQPDSFQSQSLAGLSRSVASLLQLYPGLEQPDSFRCQSVASLSRSVSSMLQLYPGLEQPHCCQTFSHADELTKTPSTWLQMYPGLERPGALQRQHQSESASTCQSGVLQVYPGLEQQYQHTEIAARSASSVLQVYPGLQQLSQQEKQQSSGTLSSTTLDPPVQQSARLESALVDNAQLALGEEAGQLQQPPESVCGALSSQPSNTYPGLESAASIWAQYKQQEGAQRAQQEGAQRAQQDGFPSMQDLEAAVALPSQQSASGHHLRNAVQTAMLQGKYEEVLAIPPATVLPVTAEQSCWGCTAAATQLSLLKVCLHASCESRCYSLSDLSVYS